MIAWLVQNDSDTLHALQNRQDSLNSLAKLVVVMDNQIALLCWQNIMAFVLLPTLVYISIIKERLKTELERIHAQAG